LPTRLFHWALVALIALQFATAKFGFLSMEWHARFGWATIALIAFRLIWGFAGSQTSRFADFVRGPAAVARYVVAPAKKPQARLGHNPLGGWSVIAMLACVLVQAISGLFATDGIDEDGPFVGVAPAATVRLATKLHHLGETVLLVLIALHIAAVLLHWVFKRDNLIGAMITGRKPGDARVPLRFVSGWRALAWFALVAGVVVLLSRFGD
jgi:cytochrome b